MILCYSSWKALVSSWLVFAASLLIIRLWEPWWLLKHGTHPWFAINICMYIRPLFGSYGLVANRNDFFSLEHWESKHWALLHLVFYSPDKKFFISSINTALFFMMTVGLINADSFTELLSHFTSCKWPTWSIMNVLTLVQWWLFIYFLNDGQLSWVSSQEYCLPFVFSRSMRHRLL